MEKGSMYLRNSQNEASSDHDDVWDDTVLIKAYDAAVNAIKGKIAYNLRFKEGDVVSDKTMKKVDNFKSTKAEWNVGAACRATYSEDGKIYEATIKSIKADTNSCIVRYVGYGNEEEIQISQLMPSEGPKARVRQEEEMLCDVTEADADPNQFYAHQESYQAKPMLNKEKGRKKNPNVGSSDREHLSNFGSQFPPPHAAYYGHPYSSSYMPRSSFKFPPSLPPPPPLNVTSGLPVDDSEALSAMLTSWYMSGFHTGYYQGLQQGKQLHSTPKQSL